MTEAGVRTFKGGGLEIEFNPPLVPAVLDADQMGPSAGVEFKGQRKGVAPVFPDGSPYADLAKLDPSMVPSWPGSAHPAPKPKAKEPTNPADPQPRSDAITEDAITAFVQAEQAELSE